MPLFRRRCEDGTGCTGKASASRDLNVVFNETTLNTYVVPDKSWTNTNFTQVCYNNRTRRKHAGRERKGMERDPAVRATGMLRCRQLTISLIVRRFSLKIQRKSVSRHIVRPSIVVVQDNDTESAPNQKRQTLEIPYVLTFSWMTFLIVGLYSQPHLHPHSL